MNKNKMKGIREILHELVIVREHIRISLYASGRYMITISGRHHLGSRGKHRGLPGRGMSVSPHQVDDLHFELFSLPDTVLRYGSNLISKELIDDGAMASKEDTDAFFENKPVEMLIDPAKG